MPTYAKPQLALKLTSPTLLMFSSRSLGLNPKSLFNPKRTLSPSSLKALLLYGLERRVCSRAHAKVDLPEAVHAFRGSQVLRLRRGAERRDGRTDRKDL